MTVITRKRMLDQCERCGHPRHEHDHESFGCTWTFGHNGALSVCGCKDFTFARRTWNCFADYIHDIRWSFGYLVLPLGFGNWVAWFRGKGWHIARPNTFHNCTRTGVY